MAPAPEIDLVLCFVPSDLKHNSKTESNATPQKELSNLINTLISAGLNVTARPASNGAASETTGSSTANPARPREIYIFVSAPLPKLAELYNAQAHADFLLGVPSPSWKTWGATTTSKDSIQDSKFTLPPADRIRLVYEYITCLKVDGGLGVVVGTSQSGSISSSGLDATQYPSIKSIFALHDQSFNRRWFKSWTRQRRGFHISFSELCKIRDEFGEAMALYFAFLTSYTSSLFIPASLGFLFWIAARPYSLVFSILLTLWSISWVEWWRIREKVISVRWGTLGSFKAERRRVGFTPENRGMNVRNDPTSEFDDLDAAFPWYKRDLRIMASVPLIILFGALLAAVLTGIFILEAFVTRLYHGPGYQYISLFPTVLFTLFIPIFLESYHKLARRLTKWENHAHDSGFDNSLTLKTFALSAIVAYLGLALSAFLYVPFGNVIMHIVEGIFIGENETQDKTMVMARLKRWGFGANRGGGLETGRLQNQMFAFTVTNQIVNTFQEIVLPYVVRGIESYRSRAGWSPFGTKDTSRSGNQTPTSARQTPERKGTEIEILEIMDEREWEAQFLQQVRKNAQLPDYVIFGDYAEMVTQFGYVALWSTIWPLAPVMAFLNNWLEMRSDAFKIMTHSRRPLPKRVESIGAWLDCMAFISWLGTLTNAALVYLFHPENHAVLSSRFGTALRTAVPGSVGGSDDTLQAPPRTHLEAHMPTNGNLSSAVASTWHVLFMPALLITFASSHGYILLRAAIGHIIRRAVWRGSKEEKEIKAVSETVKKAYLGKIRADGGKSGGSGVGYPFGVNIGVDVDEVGSDQLTDMERLFWRRDLDEAGVWSAVSGKEE